MEVHSCIKQVFLDSGEDDDGPTIFKRTNPSSKQNQLNSTSRKLSSQNGDGLVTKQTSSSPHASKNASLGLQKGKAASSSKISAEKPKVVSSPASAFVHDNAKGPSSQKLGSSCQMKVSHSSKSFSAAENFDDSDDKRPLSFKLNAATKGNNSTAVQKVPKQSMISGLANNYAGQTTVDKLNEKPRNSDDSDDDDNVPLSSKFSSASLASLKSNSLLATKASIKESTEGNNSMAVEKGPKQSMASGLAKKYAGQTTIIDKLNEKPRISDDSDDDDNVSLSAKFSSASLAFMRSNSLLATKASIKESSDDSEDEKPLLSRLHAKLGGATKSSIKESSDYSEDEKPLLSRLQATLGGATKAIIKESSYDSEDEKPLLSRFQAKLGGATSIKSDSDGKSFSSKILANGYVKKESIDGLKYSSGSSKRPICETNKTETSIKKAKVLGSSVKQEVVAKKEQMDDDHIPIAQRIKKPVSLGNSVSMKKEIKKTTSFKKDGKKMKTQRDLKYSQSSKVPPGSGGGLKWTTLVHNGVIFPPPYKPHGIKMLYNGQPVDLTPEQEEVATMFAVMKDTDYATKPKFIENFMNDWRPILGKNHIIKKMELCDFTPIYEWHLREKDKKKQMTSEEKKQLKEDKMMQEEKYMWAIVDGVKEKVGNFRVEPPGLFRGRGEHPKMGKLKRRIRPRDITINIGKGVPIPECPIPGERWKEVKHDNTVTWLAYWSDPINSKEYKYVFLAASSSLKGQSDKEKYEKARMLKKYIQNIRANYTKDFTSKDATRRQIAVATYLIDKLALRAGNEKDDDEADTVGCCTLKVDNVTLLPPNKLQFDFLGKDSIRYFNTVEVELAVYKAIGEFQTARKNDGRKKAEGDDLFDLLDTSKLNAHLKELMPGLTAKVFRTYNASITLDVMLNKETKDGNVLEKVAVYQIANKEVAIICNHQRTVSKTHDAQMSRLDEKINELKAQRKELEVDLSKAKRGKPLGKDADGKLKKNAAPDLLEKRIAQFDDKIEKMELSKKTKEDLKTVALGTSKINYLDPRISVAWCKRNEVPIEKIFNKSLLSKFSWAMDVDPEFRF